MTRYKCDVCKQFEVESVDIPTLCEHCGSINGAWLNLDTNEIEQKSQARPKVIHKSIPYNSKRFNVKTPPKKKTYKPKIIHKPKVVPKPKTVPKPRVTPAPKTTHPVKSPVHTDPLLYKRRKLKYGIAKMFYYGFLIFPFVGFFTSLFIFCIIYKIFFVEVNWTDVLVNWTIYSGFFGAVVGFIKGYSEH